MLTAGVNEKSGGTTDRNDREGRLKLLDTNVGVFKDMVPKIVAAAPAAVLLVVTDPPDVSARIAEAVLRDERVVLPIGAYNADYDVTLSLPSVVGREGVSRILEPAMSDEERRALGQSAEVLRQAVQRTSQVSCPTPLENERASK
jgi:malate/lactate dehydrogenase